MPRKRAYTYKTAWPDMTHWTASMPSTRRLGAKAWLVCTLHHHQWPEMVSSFTLPESLTVLTHHHHSSSKWQKAKRRASILVVLSLLVIHIIRLTIEEWEEWELILWQLDLHRRRLYHPLTLSQTATTATQPNYRLQSLILALPPPTLVSTLTHILNK